MEKIRVERQSASSTAFTRKWIQHHKESSVNFQTGWELWSVFTPSHKYTNGLLLIYRFSCFCFSKASVCQTSDTTHLLQVLRTPIFDEQVLPFFSTRETLECKSDDSRHRHGNDRIRFVDDRVSSRGAWSESKSQFLEFTSLRSAIPDNPWKVWLILTLVTDKN